MKRSAVIVEGQSELIFVRELLTAIAGALEYRMSLVRAVGQGAVEMVGERNNSTSPDFEILVVDVGNDERVRTYINDNIQGLKRADQVIVIGLRDLYSGNDGDEPDLALSAQLDQQLSAAHSLVVRVCYAVRELEAWFLADPRWLTSIHASLTPANIDRRLGVAIGGPCVEQIQRPANLLSQIFGLAGQRYRKKSADTERIVARLDYEMIYLSPEELAPSLKTFVTEMDATLTA